MHRLLVALLLAVSTAAPAAGLPPALSAFEGKVVYLDFWASWCAPCAESFPWLNAMRERYGNRIEVVGVNVDARETDMRRFLVSHPASFTILRDAEGALAETFGLEGMPSSVILDANGRILHRHSGFRAAERARYEDAIKAAIAAAPEGK